MADYKKAALSLHELAPRDQQWLLNRLPGTHRRKLRKLLVELEALGIPREQGWLSALKTGGPDVEGAEPVSPDPDAALYDSLSRVDAAQVKRVLDTEAEAVVAIVLAGGEWPWSGEVIDSYRGGQRRRLEASIKHDARDVPRKVTRSILRALARRLAHEPAATPARMNGTRRASVLGAARTILWRR